MSQNEEAERFLKLKDLAFKNKIDLSSLCRKCIEKKVKIITNIDDTCDFIYLDIDLESLNQIFNKRKSFKLDYNLFNFITGDKKYSSEDKERNLKRGFDDLYIYRSDLNKLKESIDELKKNPTKLTKCAKTQEVIMDILRLVQATHKNDKSIYINRNQFNASRIADLISDWAESNPKSELNLLNNSKGISRDTVYRHLLQLRRDGKLK